MSHDKSVRSAGECGSTRVHKTNDFLGIGMTIIGMSCVKKMTITTKGVSVRFLFLILIFAICSLLIPTESRAQDIYNFYFQKTPGATAPTVNSAPAPQTTPPASPPAPAPSPAIQAPLPQGQNEKSALKTWELGLYNSWITVPIDERGEYSNEGSGNQKGLGVLGAYRFNKFVSAEAGILYRNGWENSNSGESRYDDGKGFEGMLGVAVAPIHINLFGYELIELAATGGIMSMSKYTSQIDTNYEVSGVRVRRESVAYLGPRISLNLTSDLGVVLDVKTGMRGNWSNVGNLGLRWRF